jgi:hypothetical protein
MARAAGDAPTADPPEPRRRHDSAKPGAGLVVEAVDVLPRQQQGPFMMKSSPKRSTMLWRGEMTV